MKIGQSIYDAIANETLAIDQVLAAMPEAWAFFEAAALAQVKAGAIAKGFNAAAVRFFIEERAELLRAERPGRLETVKQMLESGATSLQ